MLIIMLTPIFLPLARESLPFLVAVAAVTLLLIYVPEVVLLVPDAIFGAD